MIEEYRQTFTEETLELLVEMESALMELEKSPDDGDLIGRVFRAMHTIKGGCGVVGHDYLAGFIHEVETIFDLMRSGRIPAGKELISLSLEAADHVREMLDVSGEAAPPSNERGREIIAMLNELAKEESAPDQDCPLPGSLPVSPIEDFLGVLTEYECARLRANLKKKREVFVFTKAFPFADIEEELADMAGKLKDDGELLAKIPYSRQVPAGFLGFRLLFASGKGTSHLQTALGGPPEMVDCSGLFPAELQDGLPAKPQNVTYRISFNPPENILTCGTNPVDLLKGLRRLGPCTVVALHCGIPPLAELNPESSYLQWEAILTTERGEGAIREVFGQVGDQGVTIDVIDIGSSLEMEDCSRRLGEILVERGELTPEDLRSELANQKRIGELLVERGLVGADQVRTALAEQRHAKEVRRERESRESTASIRVAAEKLDSLVNLVGQLVTVQAHLTQIAAQASKVPGLRSVAEVIARLTDEIRDNAQCLRMLPIGSTFNRFTRLVRDLAIELEKEVVLETSGAETELDKTVIEKLNDPLVHLIRNSIDHGIEPPEVRLAAGKPRRGKVHLGAVHSGDSVLITIRDDGAGLDSEAIRTRAVENGLIPGNAELSEGELFAQIFAPGFSTARKISSVSGRGVGMDVVKQAISALRGSVAIDSRRGEGTTITLKIPLTLAIIESLLVEIGSGKYVFPLSVVDECVELSRADRARGSGCQMTRVRDRLVPYVPLREMFRIKGTPPDLEQIVIARMDGIKVGFVVDRVLGEHQTVIKPFGPVCRNVHGLSGATILGDGSVALILDIPQLVQDAEFLAQR